MKQTILKVSQNYKELDYYLTNNHIQSLLLVCDKSLQNLSINSYFENLKKRTGIKVVKLQIVKASLRLAEAVPWMWRSASSYITI